MRSILSVLVTFVLLAAGVTWSACAAGGPSNAEKRIAFVVGNESYAAGALPTAANDAGLVAQTLQTAGFDVIGARDLDAETLRQSYSDFLKRLTDAGPDAVAFVYLAGYGLQYGNDNYYVPIGANVSRDLDIPIETIRLSDLTGPLNALNLKARFMVVDAAYKLPFAMNGPPLAGGLALVDAAPGSLVAYNAAPGTVAAPGKDNYGLYAQSLAAMLREGGLPPDEIFDRVRLRVNEESKGAEVPWDSSKIDAAFRFFDRNKGAPPSVASAAQTRALQTKPIKDLPVQQAYVAAIARDTVRSYADFDTAYGSDPLGKRVRVLLAVRREAITWRRSVAVDTPAAYWSYLARYPRGPHAEAARSRLETLSAALEPPPEFQVIPYDVAPPPPDEAPFIDQPAVYLDDPTYDFPPPPPPPDYWLPPVPVAFLDLPPPPPAIGLFFLPVPAFVPLPDYYDPPPFVVLPVNNYFYGGGGGAPGVPYEAHRRIHEGFPGGGPGGPAAGAGPGVRGAVVGAALIGAAAVALPLAAQRRAAVLDKRGIKTPAQLGSARRQPGGLTGRAAGEGLHGRGNALPTEQRLPGENGRPLPSANGGRASPSDTVPGKRGARGRMGSEKSDTNFGPGGANGVGPEERRGPRGKEAGPSGAVERPGPKTRDHGGADNAARPKVEDRRDSQRPRDQVPLRQDTTRQREGAHEQRGAPQPEFRAPPQRQMEARPHEQFRAPPQQQLRPPPQQFRAPPQQQFRPPPQQQFRAPQQQQFRSPPQQGHPGGGGRPGGPGQFH